MNADIKNYIENPPCPGIMDPIRLKNLFELIKETESKRIKGDVVELGSFSGTSAILLQKALTSLKSDRSLVLFDSFCGLNDFSDFDLLKRPFVDKHGIYHDAGTFYRQAFAYKSSLSEIKENFAKYSTTIPKIIVGQFTDTLEKHLPENISFAHLDSDLYKPIKYSLESIISRMSKGGIIVVDDYDKNGGIYPGCLRAVNEFTKEFKIEKKIYDYGYLEQYAKQAVLVI